MNEWMYPLEDRGKAMMSVKASSERNGIDTIHEQWYVVGNI